MLFIDTSYWIALALERDAYHAAAVAWEATIAGRQEPLMTTEAVLWETLNSLTAPLQRSRAAAL